MTIQEFNKKYLLSFLVNEMHPTKIEFSLSTINRKTLQPTLDYKKEKSDVDVEWVMEQFENEIAEGRHPEKFKTQFYTNSKRKLINNLLLKNNIKGLDAMNTDHEVDFLFK